MLLPQKLGTLTLMRRIGSDGVTESFSAILDNPAGEHVVVRRLMPFMTDDHGLMATVKSRIEDLTAVRHPILVPLLRLEEQGEHKRIVEEHVEAVSLADVIAWCKENGKTIPHNVFLNLATQICNGLEALHGRPGKASGEEHVLHLSLGPKAILVNSEARLLVGEYGLVRSPTAIPNSVPGASADRLAQLSPEQTHPDQKLSPASDIFSLGSLLFEMLTLTSLFERESSLQTIHAVRKAEVSTALQQVKRTPPGLDKVLHRALSLNPRHRYQRAFVLREDVRASMARSSPPGTTRAPKDFPDPLVAGRRSTTASPTSVLDTL